MPVAASIATRMASPATATGDCCSGAGRDVTARKFSIAFAARTPKGVPAAISLFHMSGIRIVTIHYDSETSPFGIGSLQSLAVVLATVPKTPHQQPD